MDHKPRILIVDDEADAREMLEALLCREGYDLAFAASGPEALALVEEYSPDAVLLDVMMPGMDGFEVCRRLRADPVRAEVPIILVTALDDRDSQLRGIEAGADDFVTKPVDRVELRTRVRTITRLNRYRRLLWERTRRLEAEEEILSLYHELQRHAENLEATVVQRTRELQVERDRTQSILESLGEAVIVTDVDGTIKYMNPAAVSLTGFSIEEADGENLNLWQSTAFPSELRRRVEDRICSSQKWSGETVCRRRDGTLYDAVMTVDPLCNPHDREEVSGYVSVQRDITPLRAAERLKDQFISNVSHELRTPLSVITLIVGNLDTLYDRLTEDRRRRMIRDVREHIQILSDVISDVLEISRIDSDRISRERRRVNLMQLAWEEADKQLPLAQSKSQTLRVAGAQDLPVWVNEGQLRQVIRNLLNNAIKYTPDGGQVTCEGLTVADSWPIGREHPQDAASAATGHWAALRVVDSGIGISQDDLPHVFERFYRVQAQGSIPGTGLGLSIARELVKLHNGHLSAASTPDEGSVFTIFLPLATGEESEI